MKYNDKRLNNLKKEIEKAVNRNSVENYVDMPDFLIAEYLVGCLINLKATKAANETWHDCQTILKQDTELGGNNESSKANN